MKQQNKIFLLLSLLVLYGLSGFAQIDTLPPKPVKWYDFHTKLQFAGGIGFISPGVGFSFLEDKLESDFFVGYVPKSIGGDHLVMLTLKNTYYFTSLQVKRSDVVVYPISMGGFINYTFGGQFESVYPDYYPDGYYWWASSIRLGFFLGGKITKPLPQMSGIENLSLYYELGFNDLYLVSYVQNLRYFKPYDILNLAIGIKLDF